MQICINCSLNQGWKWDGIGWYTLADSKPYHQPFFSEKHHSHRANTDHNAYMII